MYAYGVLDLGFLCLSEEQKRNGLLFLPTKDKLYTVHTVSNERENRHTQATRHRFSASTRTNRGPLGHPLIPPPQITPRGEKETRSCTFHPRLMVLPLLILKGHVIPSTMQNERCWSISPVSSLQLHFRTQSCLSFLSASSSIDQTYPLPLSTLLATNHKR